MRHQRSSILTRHPNEAPSPNPGREFLNTADVIMARINETERHDRRMARSAERRAVYTMMDWVYERG